MLDINSRVAAYITAYEDLEALDKTVTAIQRQSYPVKEIFIVDNSKTQVIIENKYENLTVEFHPENLGVAGGLKIAINWAIEKGYDFLWLFDQDSEPEFDVLKKLLIKYQELSAQNIKIGIIAPVILDINTKQEFPGGIFQQYKFAPVPEYAEIKDFYKCDAVITSGSLVNITAAQSVEPPKAEFFLDAVDYAYCMNFKNKGYEIIVVKDTMMKHRIGNYSKVKDKYVKGSHVVTFVCSPSRYYYSCRNHTFFETRASEKSKLHYSVTYRIKYSLEMIKRIIRYEPDLVSLKVWACIVGTFDGFRGKLGKTWQ